MSGNVSSAAIAAGFGQWGTILGWVVAVIGPILVYVATRRKTDVDESGVILAAWKNLHESHQQDIKSLKEEFAQYKKNAMDELNAYRATATAEISDLRDRLRDAEHRISELEAENAGLKRAIGQNSQSSAMLLGGKPPATDQIELLDAIERATEQRKGVKP